MSTIYDVESMVNVISNIGNDFYIHVSPVSGLRKLDPRIPSKNGLESKKPRVSASPSLLQSLKARYTEQSEILSVYIIDHTEKPHIMTNKEVIDATETSEVVYYKSVNVIEIGKVRADKTYNTTLNW